VQVRAGLRRVGVRVRQRSVSRLRPRSLICSPLSTLERAGSHDVLAFVLFHFPWTRRRRVPRPRHLPRTKKIMTAKTMPTERIRAMRMMRLLGTLTALSCLLPLAWSGDSMAYEAMQCDGKLHGGIHSSVNFKVDRCYTPHGSSEQ